MMGPTWIWRTAVIIAKMTNRAVRQLAEWVNIISLILVFDFVLIVLDMYVLMYDLLVAVVVDFSFSSSTSTYQQGIHLREVISQPLRDCGTDQARTDVRTKLKIRFYISLPRRIQYLYRQLYHDDSFFSTGATSELVVVVADTVLRCPTEGTA